MIPGNAPSGLRVRSLVAAVIAASAPGFAAEPPATGTPTLDVVTVIGVTPLAGDERDRSELPAQVQTASGEELDRSHSTDVTAYMNRHFGSVYVNDIQNNPLQPDVNYRGYAASPLLGTPQGLSVYLDGVRLNQPFGDVVSWDLIPRAAIRSMTLMPGSNPLFGLNTLGGALSLRSKNGFTDSGSALQLSYGADQRRIVEAETGGSSGSWSWYLTGSRFSDDGWRDFSPSEATQLFGKLGWRNDATELALTISGADTDLTGNGLQEQQLLASDYASVYTYPDNTRNQARLVNLELQHRFSDAVSLSANAYYRNIRSSSLNGDINEAALGENLYQPSDVEQDALTDAGYSGFPTSGENAANTPFPSWRCIANVLINGEPNEKCNGLLNRSSTSQHNEGFSGQLTFSGELGARANRMSVGGAFDQSRVHFTQSSQFGYLTPERGVIGVEGDGAFADGSQDSENAFDSRVDLGGRTTTWSLFFNDTLHLTPQLHLTVAGRYDHSSIHNRDALNPGGGTGSLDGDHDYSRINPAAGLSYNPNDALSLYVNYGQGSRAPSAIELGCADPESPCRLPNSMAGDPPLSQVVTTTWETGVRGQLNGNISWNAAVFRAVNRDDILFVADTQAGFGYFRNFGSTRRQGVELGINGRIAAFRAGAQYSHIDATFRSAEVVNGEANSSNDAAAPGFEGNIEIEPGDRIPLTPRHILKGYLGWDISARFSVDADAIYIGGSYARGNENNQHETDNLYYLGPGSTGGYTVFNLGAEFHPVERLKLFVQVNNLLDHRYATGSQLGATGFDAAGNFVGRPFTGPVIDAERPLRHATFYAPGAPRTWLVGVRYEFGGA